ncbi:HNH endonuclease [Sphingomonas oryzagri]
MASWPDALTKAIRRHVAKTGSSTFTRQAFIADEIGAILAETRAQGSTPTQTMGRELQELRDAGLVQFVKRGTYRWLGDMPELEPATPSKGLFLLPAHPAVGDVPERGYPFPSRWLRTARRLTGQWIVYQAPHPAGGGDYVAVARVDRIDAEPDRTDRFVARIDGGSYLEFGRQVPFLHDDRPIERGLIDADGRLNRGLAARPVRPMSDADFNRIVERGLITEKDLLPRIDGEDDGAVPDRLFEERSGWDGPVDRATMLVNRTVRDRQFRKRVLDIYGARCALTGMKLINGGGRAETEAAHIMSVEAGGPDAVNNGIALSGTIHWMFDRGLISLSDAGDILLSREINDRDSVERLVHRDRKARFPEHPEHRPHPRYLHWHRTQCFHG